MLETKENLIYICLIMPKKIHLKGETGIDISLKLAKIVGLTNLSDIDRVDVYKLETTPVDLSKISVVVKYDVVKNTVFVELVKDNTIQAIDTSNLVKKN